MLTDTSSRFVAAQDFLIQLETVLESISPDAVFQAIELLLETRATRHRVYVIGNGGSAATASHLACDLIKTAQVAGCDPLRVFALTDNIPLFSAWANDAAYEDAFAEQISAFVDPGDVVFAISASGNSPNVVNGLAAGRGRGARTIGLLGFDGGLARPLADIALHVPCFDYGLVEAAHLAIVHALTVAIREALEQTQGP